MLESFPVRKRRPYRGRPAQGGPDIDETKPSALRIAALAGGVGGAKLSWGLSRVMDPARLTVISNTGDDETFYGLHVSPDLDTQMYTLAGLVHEERGWGLAGETFHAIEMFRRYGEESWFSLGDLDLATHVLRTRMLRDGLSLTQVTHDLSRRLGVPCGLAPATDDRLRTTIATRGGPLSLQSYFVEHKCEPVATGVSYEGSADAAPSPAAASAIDEADAIVFCPSNPVISIAPVLAVAGIRERVARFRGPRVAVSPLVGGRALRGPAAKLMGELGEDVSSAGVAERLAGLCDVLVIDHEDAPEADAVRARGIEPVTRATIMNDAASKERLAREVLDLIEARMGLEDTAASRQGTSR